MTQKSVMQAIQEAIEPMTDRYRVRQLEGKEQRLDELTQVIREHNAEMKDQGHD